MRIVKGVLLTLILAAALAGQVAPQRPTTEAPDPTQQIVVDVDVVNIVFAVADRKNKFITNLKKEDFRVYEDELPQTITSFSSETDLPLTMALLVDTSGSIRDKLKFEQEAAIEFFYSTLMPGKDKAAVYSFDSSPALLQDFTDNPETLANAVNRIRAGGGTALYDAVHDATSQKLSKQTGARRVIILISDGDDNSSRISLTETLEAAQKNEIVVYAIGTNHASSAGGRDSGRGDKTLRRLADETGGRAFFPFQMKDLSESFQDIHEELRAQYSMAYIPANYRADGSFHKIRIEIVNRQYRDLKVRARAGYYAVKSPASIGR
jgi:Ca-activated chloride channel family protein